MAVPDLRRITDLPDEDEAYAWLYLHWGGAYHVCIEGGEVAWWTAYRIDDTGPRIAARSPAGLEAALRADLAALEGAR